MNKQLTCSNLSIGVVSWGGRSYFPETAAHRGGLVAPGPALQQLHDVAQDGAFIPPGPENRRELAATSPPIQGDFGAFPASGGAFRRPAAPNPARPVTARVSAFGKVYI